MTYRGWPPRPKARAPKVVKPAAPVCRAMRQGDEMACSCGMRWALDESHPPKL